MKYEKPEVEVVKFDTVGFMTTSAGNSCFAVRGGSLSQAEIATTGLGGCNAVTWNGTFSNDNPSWPLINCSAVTFGNGTYKDDKVYSVPCKTYHS